MLKGKDLAEAVGSSGLLCDGSSVHVVCVEATLGSPSRDLDHRRFQLGGDITHPGIEMFSWNRTR
jgi:hypothetical protein